MKKSDLHNVLVINHKAELLFWLIVILITVAVFSLNFIYREVTDENDYHVFMPDVDGLIVGSPVRMMGVEVGHVVKIKPVKDEVYIKFILTNPDLTIPRGTKITVEFSGMAGSKSLELYPNTDSVTDKDTPMFDVNPPKRLRDAFSLLDNIYKKITSIIWNISAFGEKLEGTHINSIEFNKNEQINEFLEYSNEFITDSREKAEELKNNIEGFRNHGKEIR